MSDVFDQWYNGDLSDQEALRPLALALAEVQARKAKLEADELELRLMLAKIVAKTGKTSAGGLVFEVTQPMTVASFDTRQLERLVLRLMSQGHDEIADQIAACRKESMRAGGLRVSKEKTNATVRTDQDHADHRPE